MRVKRFLYRFTLLATASVMLLSGTAMAQSATDDKRAAMLDLARSFVQKIDEGFKQADDYWFSLKGNNADKSSYLDQYQDGEILLLEITLPNNVRLGGVVSAEKQGRDILLSLADLVIVAGFPIALRPQEGIAEGWFIRENKKFFLDYNNLLVRSAGKEYNIDPASVRVDDDDIWVRGEVLAQWLGFDMQVNANRQILEVEPDSKWPVQEKIERDNRVGSYSNRRGPAVRPRQVDPYKVAEIPKADVYLNHRWSRRGEAGSKATSTSNYTVRTTGDVAGHTGEAIITGNDTNKLSSARFKFKKESENHDLLGPLQASQYEFGDIVTTDMPLINGSNSELGVRVTNRNPYYTQNTQTTISGYSIPGWDVELYRDQQYIDIATVSDDGFYKFDGVLLNAGENRFRVVQYGLQGQVEEQEFVKFVDASIQGASNGVYDVSLSMNDTQTYLKTNSEDVDSNTPHLSATYEVQATNNLALHSGVKLREEDGEQKAYVQAGAVANLAGVIVNADAAMDDKGAYATSLSGRKTARQQSVGATLRYTGEDYTVNSSQPRDAELSVSGTVNGRLPSLKFLDLNNTSYDFKSEYITRGDDYTAYRTAAGLSASYDKLNFNTGVNYRIEDNTGTVTRDLDGRVGVRGNYLNTLWRVTASADLYPEYKPSLYEVELQKYLTDDIQGRVKVDYSPETRITETELGASWTGDHIVLSPNLTYDTEKNITAFVNARFGLVYNPTNNDVEMHGTQLSNRGGVSARVYLDRDGDSTYSEGDELIEGARIESLQTSRFALSNSDGVAFIPDLPTNRITDIVLNEGSLFDPFWIAGFEGASIRPRAGHTSVLDFPVHMSGEIDGTLFMVNQLGTKSPAKNMRLHLYDKEGELQETAYTAFDGFYLFSRIPPGEYLLMVDADDARNRRISSPAPQNITIGYEGTIIAGNNIIGQIDGAGSVGFEMVQASDFGADLAKVDVSMLAGKKIILNMGDYNSQLLMALTWYNMRNRYGAILGNAKLLVPPSDSLPSLASNKHTMRVTTEILNLEDARFICRSLIARGFQCGVELLPDEFFAVISAGAANPAGKS